MACGCEVRREWGGGGGGGSGQGRVVVGVDVK